MRTVTPDCCAGFSCIAGACRHSCCVGWEIDIDDGALRRYRAVPGELGERLREAIGQADGAAHFRLTPEERCPFLNRDNLCDLIIAMGEDSLCQICADHPRFRNEWLDRTEIGLGLCCEAAGRLILGWEEPARLVTADDDGAEETLDDEEAALLALRDGLIARMQARSVSFAKRLEALSERCGYPERPWHEWRDFLLTLERLDDAWATALNALPDDPPLLGPDWDAPCEQLAVYLLFRHLPGALEDGDIQGRVRFCVLITRLLRTLLAVQTKPSMEDFVELARLYSSEIEYSDENVGAILDELACLG
ncbi:MAG: flagellin lysine-N-methylase [Christensenellaceae bacterium]|nr:flagellin lysine-N-methylase [Christensenellaceae bacterium]